jgi:hypothetical protein
VQDGDERHLLTHIFGKIGAEATFKSFTLTVGWSIDPQRVCFAIVGR